MIALVGWLVGSNRDALCRERESGIMDNHIIGIRKNRINCYFDEPLFRPLWAISMSGDVVSACHHFHPAVHDWLPCR